MEQVINCNGVFLTFDEYAQALSEIYTSVKLAEAGIDELSTRDRIVAEVLRAGESRYQELALARLPSAEELEKELE